MDGPDLTEFQRMKELVGRIAAQLSTLHELAEAEGIEPDGVKENVVELLREADELS